MRLPFYFRVATNFFSGIAFLIGVLLALSGLVFFDNFNFANKAHLGILAASFFTPVFVMVCWLFFRGRASLLSTALMLSSYVMTAVAWFLWELPAARGLVH